MSDPMTPEHPSSVSTLRRCEELEELLREAGEALEPFGRLGDLVINYDDFRARVSKGHWPDSFRRASTILQKINSALGRGE